LPGVFIIAIVSGTAPAAPTPKTCVAVVLT
jgi:hypothetical protein